MPADIQNPAASYLPDTRKPVSHDIPHNLTTMQSKHEKRTRRKKYARYKDVLLNQSKMGVRKVQYRLTLAGDCMLIFSRAGFRKKMLSIALAAASSGVRAAYLNGVKYQFHPDTKSTCDRPDHLDTYK